MLFGNFVLLLGIYWNQWPMIAMGMAITALAYIGDPKKVQAKAQREKKSL